MSLGRILLAVAVAACLLGVGVLEVLSERAPREQVLPTFPRVGELHSHDSEPWWESGEAVSGQALESALVTPEGALIRGPLSRPLPLLEAGRNPSMRGEEHPAASLASLQRETERIER